jgi:hypothetical protein
LLREGTWTVERHLHEKPTSVVQLYHRFASLVEACGPVKYSVSKTSITFKGTRRGFAGAHPRIRSLDGYLDLQQRIEDPRIFHSSPFTRKLFVNHFRVTRLDQFDKKFESWVRKAYEVGQGKHLKR